jgi:DNA polymerase I
MAKDGQPLGVKMYALDIETAPVTPTDFPYALEPYRVLTNQSKITSVAVYGEDIQIQLHENMPDFHDKLFQLLNRLNGKIVYCHNAIFDVSYLIATTDKEICRPINWADTAILNKWVINGDVASDKNLSYSLKECVRRAKLDDPDVEEFLELKSQKVIAGEDEDYWLKRGMMDARLTYKLAVKLNGYLKTNHSGLTAVYKSIFPLSVGYVMGINVDMDLLMDYKQECIDAQKSILEELGIDGKVITSTKQLADLLFVQWGLEPVMYTPKGAPSTNAESLLRLQQTSKDPRFALLMKYKTLATMASKYINGIGRSTSYIGSNKIHGVPRLLSTITGRMTYSSQMLRKDAYQVSIAMHQLPRRDKHIKRCMVAPPGYKILYMDASAQESRVMAIVANEETMIDAFNHNKDLHSLLTEEIFGTSYEEIVEANKIGSGKVYEQRQAGKLTGLSSFYRIGAKSLSGKFFSTYEYDISIGTALSYLKSFKAKYPGIVRYWDSAIYFAQQNGYAEAWGGFRYRISKLDWKGESSAINHPIQAGGSIMTYTTIAIISKRFPELILVAQVHDSLAYYMPDGYNAKEVIDYVSNFNYGRLLGFDQTIPLKWDGGIGDNFSDINNEL